MQVYCNLGYAMLHKAFGADVPECSTTIYCCYRDTL